MLLSLAQWLQGLYPDLGFLRVFNYITFRAVMAALTALLIGLAFGPWVIRRLTEMKIGQPIREYGVQQHLAKSGTPTMGGVLILIGIGVSTLLWFDWSNRFVWVVMMVTMGFGAIGWVDDWRKVVDKNPEGMRSREKFFWQSLIGLVAALYLAFSVSESSFLGVVQLFTRWVSSGFSTELPPKADLLVPFFKTVSYPLGVFGFIALSYFVIVGTSNAVNFTDGLDGLAIMPVVLVGSALGVFAYLTGSTVYSRYLLLPYIPGAGELMIFCAAMAGAGLAFLWFNTHPAQVFMGDVGALSLGGGLGTLAVITRQEIVLGIMGGVFVAEVLSVMIQVSWFKYTKKKFGTGRRIFKMAPLHHHFEKSGWKETQVVVRFWIITMLLCLVGLASLEAALMNKLDGLEVLVLGLGDSGLAMAAWVTRYGATARVWDSRANPPQLAALNEQLPQVGFIHGELPESALDGIQLVLKSPGLSPLDARLAALLTLARNTGVPVQGELDLFARALAELKAERRYEPAVLAITGTNGKTTTTCMTALLVERAGKRVVMAGNIGPSMLTTLAQALDLEPAPVLVDEPVIAEVVEPVAEEAASEQTALEEVDAMLDAMAEQMSENRPLPISHHRRKARVRAPARGLGAGAVELPARRGARLRAHGRRGVEPDTGPPRLAWRHGGLWPRQGAHLPVSRR